tara:strand:+ start:2678 stop:2881 length:204 start_codon:yes stop_codon:yes gene_type:complete
MSTEYKIGDFVEVTARDQYYKVGYILQIVDITPNWIKVCSGDSFNGLKRHSIKKIELSQILNKLNKD